MNLWFKNKKLHFKMYVRLLGKNVISFWSTQYYIKILYKEYKQSAVNT